MPGQLRRLDPNPGIIQGYHRLTGVCHGRQRDVAAAVRIFHGVIEQVGKRLGQPGEVRTDPERVAGQVHGEGVPGRFNQRLDGFDSAPNGGPQIEPLSPQFDPVAGDPGHIQQIVGQANELTDLPLHDRQGALAQRGIAAGAAHQFERIPNRRERIAQLVRQRGQEFILSPIRFAQHVFSAVAFGHVEADAHTPGDVTVTVVQRLDVVLDVPHRAVRAGDLDDVGHVRAMGHGVLHRQLTDRHIASVALDAVERHFARVRAQRHVDTRRHAKQAGKCVVGRDEPAVRIVGDRDRNRRSRDQVGERTEPRAQLLGGSVDRWFE